MVQYYSASCMPNCQFNFFPWHILCTIQSLALGNCMLCMLKEASDGKGVKVHLIIFNAVVSVKSVMSHLLVVN